MTIHAIANTTESKNYHLDFAADDYYTSGGEPPGRWAGTGIHSLINIQKTPLVDDKSYLNLIDGRAPDGSALVKNAGSEDRVVGWDATFSAPKSLSVLWARADDDMRRDIQRAQANAVKHAVSRLEKHCAITGRGTGGRTLERVPGLMAATFEHATSREMDPQLHTHLVIFNVAQRVDGSYGTIEPRPFFTWQKSAGAMYRAALAAELRQIGIEVESTDNGLWWEVAGVPEGVCQHFSKRSEQIEAELARVGAASSASAIGDQIKVSTRQAKTDVNRAELLPRWQSEMDGLGFTTEKLNETLREHHKTDQLAELRQKALEDLKSSKLLQRKEYRQQLRHEQERAKEDYSTSSNSPIARMLNPLLPLIDQPTAEIQAALDDAFLAYTRERAVIAEHEVHELFAGLATELRLAPDAASRAAAGALADEEVIDLATGINRFGRHLHTTQAQLAAERELIATAKAMAADCAFRLPEGAVDKVLAEQERPLSEEQQEAVLAACAPGRFSIVKGSAGVGKSTLLNAVRAAHQDHGYRIIGAAVAKAAANNLQNESRIESHTIAKLLSALASGAEKLDRKTAIVIDEAGQISTPQLAALAEAAQKAGSKIVLVGDDRQLDAVQHGGMLRYLSRADVVGTTNVSTIRRQHQEWARQAVADLRDGKALAALEAHEQRGQIHLCQDREATLNSLVDRWQQMQAQDPAESTIVLARKWTDVLPLSQKIRQLHIDAGRVAAEGPTLQCVVGDRNMDLQMAVGDDVRFTRNEYRVGLTNGQTGKIEAIHAQPNGHYLIDVRDSTGVLNRVDTAEYVNEFGRLHMVHSYASTVYASQGLTMDRTLVLGDMAMDQKNAYVAGSRHRQICEWFFDANSIVMAAGKGQPMTADECIEAVAKSMSVDRGQRIALEHYEEMLSNRAQQAESEREDIDELEIAASTELSAKNGELAIEFAI